MLYFLNHVEDIIKQALQHCPRGDELWALVLDLCSLPNTICNACHISLEKLLTDETLRSTIQNTFAAKGVKIGSLRLDFARVQHRRLHRMQSVVYKCNDGEVNPENYRY